jgi:hypothetical protein
MVARLRPFLTAVLIAVSGPVLAGGGHPHHPPPHQPLPKPPAARAMPPQAHLPTVLPPAGPVAPAPAPVAIPFGTGFYPYPVLVPAAPPPPVRIAERPVRPLSFHAIDPRAVVSRTPSGRTVVTVPGSWRRATQPVQPYAPPAFHIIGAAPARNMARPVHLVHGVSPAANRPTEPRVIWLKQPTRDKAVVRTRG